MPLLLKGPHPRLVFFLTGARQNPLTSPGRRGPACVKRRSTWGMKKQVARALSFSSSSSPRDAIKLMRFPEFLWIQPDAKYITSNKLTSNYCCGTPLPDVQQMGAWATKGVSTHALCYSAVKEKKKWQCSCVCVCVLNHCGLWAGGEGKDRGMAEEKWKHIIRKM